jgi:hypothetical protein
MAIAVLVLWALTACAGLRLLFTSGLGRARSADAQAEAQAEAEAEVHVKEHATAGAPPTRRDIRRAERARFDTPELVRSRKESVGSLREVVEFVHPACAIVGLAFWMGYTLVHNRALAWIAFGLAATTASFGVAWFLSNRKNKLFSARLIAIHGSGAALTFVLAALTALTARG